jgi:DNA-binding FrmR family transcriptional regulator
MFDSIVHDSIEGIYRAVEENKECNEEIIQILIKLHCYINKPHTTETPKQKAARTRATRAGILKKVKRIIEHGLDSADD